VQVPGKNDPVGATMLSASMTIYSRLSFSYIRMLRLVCLMLLRQAIALAFSFAFASAGRTAAGETFLGRSKRVHITEFF
jgi:hypothetical protein